MSDIRTKQLNDIAIIERTCSVFSLLGCVFIITSFTFSKAFHKPINRLVFYASFGNMMANVGTLMSRNYVEFPSSAGCQFQAFLLQTFMPADTFWTLSMAINVYLTFYWNFSAAKLRKMELPYIICCYGIPFIPAFIFIFIDSPSYGRFYGNATLWCWITTKWDVFRIAAFYGPIWLVILVTMLIYARTGHKIYVSHKQLRNFNISTDRDPIPLPHGPLSSFKTTEVVVTTESVNNALPTDIDLAPLGGHHSSPSLPPAPNAPYSVAVIASKPRPESLNTDDSLAIAGNGPTGGPINGTARNEPNRLKRRAAFEANSAAWSYTKCAILFFTAMLVTWIPSSANRVYSVVHKNQALVTLEYMSAFVLPLQGFWNSIIYIAISRKACQTTWNNVLDWVNERRNRCSRNVTELVHKSSDTNSRQMRRPTGRTYENESMAELASSASTRPTLC